MLTCKNLEAMTNCLVCCKRNESVKFFDNTLKKGLRNWKVSSGNNAFLWICKQFMSYPHIIRRLCFDQDSLILMPSYYASRFLSITSLVFCSTFSKSFLIENFTCLYPIYSIEPQFKVLKCSRINVLQLPSFRFHIKSLYLQFCKSICL